MFGFMGTGKTAVARVLGEKLGREVVEMDKLIEEREGTSISRIFAEQGEDYFRRRERELVGELSRGGGKIIATGGGVVLDPENLRDFRENGVLVCLDASPEAILKRVEGESHRPLLEVSDRLKTIKEILEKRRAFYGEVDHRIDTSGLSVEEVAECILGLVDRL